MKRFLSLMAGAALAFYAAAVPANPRPQVTQQPDGTQVTLQLCGDEFYSFSTTTVKVGLGRGEAEQREAKPL